VTQENKSSIPAFGNAWALFLDVDGTTDESEFQKVNGHRGLSIKVGPGESSARFRFERVGQVVRWLEDYVQFLREAEGKCGHGA